MGQTIAERAIYGTVDGAEVRVQVCIGAPHQEGESDWSCSYVFNVGDYAIVLKSGTAWGVDGVQAILNALHGAGHALDRSGVEWSMFSAEELAADRSTFREDGFPRADLNVMFLGTAFRTRMRSYVAGEAEQAMKARSGRA